MKKIISVSILIFAIVANAFCVDKEIPLTKRETCQKFFKSILQNDKEGVLSTILPAEGAEILWQGQAPPKEMLKQIEKAVQNLSIIEINEGETVELPNGKSFVITKEMINTRFIWVTMGGKRMPTPFLILKVKGNWKIDAKPLIAGRKAAKKIREQRKEKKQ